MSLKPYILEPTKYTIKKLFMLSDIQEIIFRHGHIAITNYKMGDNPEFEKSLSVFDEYTWKYHLSGGYYVKRYKEFRINRGYDVEQLRRFFPNLIPRVENDPYPYDDVKLNLTAGPRSDFQRVALTFMAGKGEYKSNKNFTQQIIDADTGEGKSTPDDTMVPTPNGITRLDHLEIGDKVFNKYGYPVSILAIYPQKGKQETYELTFSDNRKARCNIEHLWNVRCSDGIERTMPLADFIDDFEKYSITMAGAVQYFNDIEDTLVDPSIIVDYIVRQDMNTLSDVVKYSSVVYRYKLLYGIFNIDENDTLNNAIFNTEYEKLKNDIVEIIQSLGCLAYVDKADGMYTIRIITNEADLYIINIKKVKKSYQRCILIDDPAHIYLTENFVPTHNTYCGVAISCYHSVKTVIFVPFSKLLEQWKDSYLNFTTIKENEIMIVQGSKACKKIVEGECKHIKIFLFMVDTLYAYQKKHGDLETIELLRATGAYMKIVDEIHRDMKTISMVEALSNFKMNYYMSASPGRSDRKENWIFKCLFRNVPRFGSNFKLQEEKHLNIIIKKYNFIPSQQQLKKMVKRKGQLNVKTYESVLIESPNYQKAEFDKSLYDMLCWSKNLLKENNKILILVSTIAGTEYVQQIAEKVFPGETSQYYGTMGSDKLKKEALKARIICATVSSLGTGADIKNMQHVYNCTTYANWIDATQISGRARKLSDGTQVIYCELVNFGFHKTIKQYEKRKPFLVKRAKNGKLLVVN